jgi:formylglycine-generating enzyme required for sulfatase activity
VTVAAWAACKGCKPAGKTSDGTRAVDRRVLDELCSAAAPGHDKHPITCVDWEAAADYCKIHEMRLPTEAEWERAARGNDPRRYPWGNGAPGEKLLNSCDAQCIAWKKKHLTDLITSFGGDLPLLNPLTTASDGFEGTAPVGTFGGGVSPVGAEDMAGNAAEWVADWYAPYAAGAATDPAGPEAGTHRVVRGGSFLSSRAVNVSAAFRDREIPGKRSPSVGFRCAKSL